MMVHLFNTVVAKKFLEKGRKMSFQMQSRHSKKEKSGDDEGNTKKPLLQWLSH